MADTFGTPEMSPEINEPQNNSKTIIILIILIILAAIGLGIAIAVQNKNNTPKPAEEQNKVAPVATTPNNVVNAPITTTPKPVDKEALAKRRAERAPNNIVTKKQLETNSKREACWTVVDNVVYDVSNFIGSGNAQALQIKDTDICGKDATKILTEERSGRPPIEEVGPFSPYSRPIGKLEK